MPCAGVATGVVLVRDNDVIPGLDGLPRLGSVCTWHAHAGRAAQITVDIAQIQPRHLNQTSGSTALNAIIASAYG